MQLGFAKDATTALSAVARQFKGRGLKRIAQIVWLLVLALWLPCTMHCALEAAGIPLPDCCPHAVANDSSSGGPPADPCRDCQVCSAIESGDYLKRDSSVEVTPLLAAVWCWVVVVRPILPVASEVPSPWALSRPEAAPSWRFVERVALSPRAPSFLS